MNECKQEYICMNNRAYVCLRITQYLEFAVHCPWLPSLCVSVLVDTFKSYKKSY